ncbi:MAG TPA: AAA family ATPase [Bradyrhizobium sp.]|nr:AAA family ATPase [Bradyrhizobium sp.]
MPPSLNSANPDGSFQVLWKDGERVFSRGWRRGADGEPNAVLIVAPLAEHPTSSSLDRLAHENGLKDALDESWAVLPLDLIHEGGRAMLVLKDPGGESLQGMLDAPMEIGCFLRLAISIATALGKVHQCGLIHKDIKPGNILMNREDREVRLTGFGIASRLPRERQAPAPPETIAGTLAYMAPEQTGRMNRSIDARSDLYALGVTYYEMLTATLPFTATDPMELVHCHLARRAMPPDSRVAGIPAPVSAVVMRLLAKAPEDRYQTAAGVEADLRRCLSEWEAAGNIEPFSLGSWDIPDVLRIPEKLYGREQEIQALDDAFTRMVSRGTPELVLISGYSGIGKSSVVNELHKTVVVPRGLFASGKFDRYQRDTPYATLARLFRDLIRHVLAQREEDLAIWRAVLQEVLGPNGRLVTELVPELELLIGAQSPVPELPPQESENRFLAVLAGFLRVFARPEQPLVLFLDDLQWLDAATLRFLAHVVSPPRTAHLLVIGAYRDNEVSSTHPLILALEQMRDAGAIISEMVLGSLSSDDFCRMVSDSLGSRASDAEALGRLVHEKTAGNPFFAIQFLNALWEEHLLARDPVHGAWAWSIDAIRAHGFTENVVDLMVGKLTRLPTATQQALKDLALLGNVTAAATLALVRNQSAATLDIAILEAVRAGLVLHSDGSYAFAHDRIQEAAYSLIAESGRAAEHLRIGRLFASRTAPRDLEEKIFEIVNHLNRGAELITSTDERQRLAELNLIAGRRAKQSAAYAAALKFFATGCALLAQDSWEQRHALAFALESQRAECEFLTGEHASAEQRLALLSRRATGSDEKAAVACLRIDLLMTLGRSEQSVEVGLEYLRSVGVAWPTHPGRDEMQREFDRIWQQLGERPIHALIDLPFMEDLGRQAQLNVLTALLPPALFTNENLFCLIVARMANFSMEHGNTHGSCLAYVWLGLLLGPHFDNYPAAFEFGRLGLDLVERRGLTRFRARVYLDFSHVVNPWKQHARSGPALVRRALNAANELGDLTFAAYSSCNLISALLAAGAPLAEVQQEAQRQLEFARHLRFGLIIDIVTGQLRLIMALRGVIPRLGSFDGGEFEEAQFERRLEQDPGLMVAIGWYWVRKLQGRVLAGEDAGAIAAGARVEPFLWTIRSHLEIADYHFYAAVACATAHESASAHDQSELLPALRRHHAQLAVWAQNCPENFEARVALLAAEIARIEGREFEAQRLYQESIRRANSNELVHDEALANERAGRFYLRHGFDKIAYGYLRDARHCYSRWGAAAKVRQLDESYAHLHQPGPLSGAMSTIGAPVEQLDLATVISVSQAVAGEIVLEKLIDTLMRTAMAQAGAERALLTLGPGPVQRIAAQATTTGDRVAVHLRDETVSETSLPESILHYVVRSRENVILDDAAAESPFVTDTYIRDRHVRSVLCLPLLHQAKLIGVLYLENNLAPRVFAPARITVLKLLASQAAVSLENTRLYRALAEREARIRRLVDANIIGIFIWEFEGRILEANDAFLRTVGYDREDLIAGRMRWTDLTPSDWLGRDERRWIPELKMTGSVPPFEKEYFRKDGSRVPVLIGAATFEEHASQGVAFVLDLTERKRAEEALRQVEGELAHANRVATMGQLTASIVHEVSQPIAGAAASGQAALRWLADGTPNVEAARQSVERIIRDINRAREVIQRVRDVIKKAAPLKDSVDINEATREVVALTLGEAAKNGVTVETQLADGLPLIEGDRVQLQQVILNLVINAIQAMSSVPHGRRELRVNTARSDTDAVLVTVQDSGPGLGEANPERLFDAFYTTKPDGLGMGLAICQSIINAHGGKLSAMENPPHGAIFQFIVPMRRDGSDFAG